MARQHYQENVTEADKRHFGRYLSEDEELIIVTGLSGVYLRQVFMLAVFWPGIVFFLLALAVGYILKLELYISLIVGLFVAIVIGSWYAFLTSIANKYLLTTRRVLVKKGFFSVKLSSVLYDKVTHIEVEQNFMDKVLLNHGKIIINTAGSNKDELVLNFIEAPMEFKNILERLINRERERFGHSAGPVVAVEGELVD